MISLNVKFERDLVLENILVPTAAIQHLQYFVRVIHNDMQMANWSMAHYTLIALQLVVMVKGSNHRVAILG